MAVPQGELKPDWALIAGRGTVLICEPNAAPPTRASLEAFADDYTALPAGFYPIGVTGDESLPEGETEGGESEVLDLWEFPAARTVETETPVDTLTIKPAQFDNTSMALYSGGGDDTGEDIFWTPAQRVPTRAGVCVVYIDSIGRVVGRYRPKNDLIGQGGIVVNTDNWGEIPIVATRLSDAANPGGEAWIGEGFGTPGTP